MARAIGDLCRAGLVVVIDEFQYVGGKEEVVFFCVHIIPTRRDRWGGVHEYSGGHAKTRG